MNAPLRRRKGASARAAPVRGKVALMPQRPLVPGVEAARLTIKLAPSDSRAIDQLAERRGVTRSYVARQALAEYLAKHHQEAARAS